MLLPCHHLAVSLAGDDVSDLLTEDQDQEVVRSFSALLAFCDPIDAALTIVCLAPIQALFPRGRIPRGDLTRWRAVDRLRAQQPNPFAGIQRQAPQVRRELAAASRRCLSEHKVAVEAQYRAAAPAPPERPHLTEIAAIRPLSLFADQLLKWLAANASLDHQPPRGRAIWSLLALRASPSSDGTMHCWESAGVSTRLESVRGLLKEFRAPKTVEYLNVMLRTLPGPAPANDRSRLSLSRRVEATGGDLFRALARRVDPAVIRELVRVLNDYVRRHAATLEGEYQR